MPGQGKAVPAAGSEAGQDLEPEFTFEELLDELAQFKGPPARLPGDIDCKQVQAKHGVNEKQAKGLMKRAAASGDWEYLRVYDVNRGVVVGVIRKK